MKSYIQKLLLAACAAAAVVWFSLSFNSAVAQSATHGTFGKSLPDRMKDLEEAMNYAKARVVPAGTVEAYAGPVPPKGWLLCDGSALDKNQEEYMALYEAIKECWGNGKSHGRGSAVEASERSNFNIPDLRGVFLRGVDGSAGLDADNSASSNGGLDGKRFAEKSGGNAGNSVGSSQNDAFRSHNHGSYTTEDDRSEARDIINLRQPAQDLTNAVNSYGANSGWRAYTWQGKSYHQHKIQNDGGNETRPKNVYVNYIIKL